MRNLTRALMAVVVCSLIVFLPYNLYAFSYEMKSLPFRLFEVDELDFSIQNIFAKYENSNYNSDNNIENQEEDILKSNEEIIYDIQKNQKKKTYLRAATETLVILGFVSAFYWGTEHSSDDFDYDISFDTLKKKLSGEYILFEDNKIRTNSFPGHPLSGAYYYSIARNNNLSRTESFLWSFAASMINELFIEYTEVASLNDIIVTPVAGATLGEAMYEFGKYFRCAKDRDNLIHKILAAVIDPVALGHSFIWSDVPYKYSKNNICSYTPIQKDINIFTGAGFSYREHTNNINIGPIFGFHGKLYFIPQYGRAADVDKFFKEPILSEIGIELGVTDKGVDNIRFLAKAVWTAYYRQNIAQDPAGKTTGYSFYAGLASAFEHIQYDTGEFEDWIGAVHILGPSLELASFYRAGYIRISLDVFGDFAMVRSYAFDEYKKGHRIDNIKSVLMNQNYYYAYGVYINPKIELRHGSRRFLAEYKYAYYDSFEGRDRRNPTNDFNLIDKQQEYSVVVGQQLNFVNARFFKNHEMWIEAEARRIARSGFIADDKISHAGGNTWLLLRFKMML